MPHIEKPQANETDKKIEIPRKWINKKITNSQAKGRLYSDQNKAKENKAITSDNHAGNAHESCLANFQIRRIASTIIERSETSLETKKSCVWVNDDKRAISSQDSGSFANCATKQIAVICTDKSSKQPH